MNVESNPVYLEAVKSGPKAVVKPVFDLTLGVELQGQKLKDFYKFLCGKKLPQLNLSTP